MLDDKKNSRIRQLIRNVLLDSDWYARLILSLFSITCSIGGIVLAIIYILTK